MTISSIMANRDVRQRELVPAGRLSQVLPLVIGVGAIGRQVAIQLATLGASRLVLVDPDEVRVENLAPQGYWPENLGHTKVNATAEACRRIHPPIDVAVCNERFRRSDAKRFEQEPQIALFLCVDSIATRGLIWSEMRSLTRFMADGRMHGEVIRVLASEDPLLDVRYHLTLFPPERAYVGACTSRSTIYAASVAAGMMIGQFAKWLRLMPVDPDQTLNLFSADYSAGR